MRARTSRRAGRVVVMSFLWKSSKSSTRCGGGYFLYALLTGSWAGPIAVFVERFLRPLSVSARRGGGSWCLARFFLVCFIARYQENCRRILVNNMTAVYNSGGGGRAQQGRGRTTTNAAIYPSPPLSVSVPLAA